MTLSITSDTTSPWREDTEISQPGGELRRIALLTLLTIGLGCGGLLTWAALARIESAVPGTGTVVSGGKRKTVSLMESGILTELLVSEGSRVERGQVLFRLDDTQIRTARAQGLTLYWSAVARGARLAAEAAGRRELPVDKALWDMASAEPSIAAAVAAEASQFHTRWSALDTAVQVQRRKIAQQQARIASVVAQTTATTSRLGFIREELRDVEYLRAKGLSTRPKELDLRRSEADLDGQLGQLAAQLNEATQAIAQIEAEIINLTETRRSEIARERSETQAARSDAEQRLKAAEDLLGKREITAPEAGIVTDIRLFTPGSGIQAGQPVMDLVPGTAELLVEAKVSPLEVEHLAIGQRVNIRLTAYKAHRVPVLPGHLIYVGADRQVDPTNQPFFLVRAELDPDAIRNKPGVVLLPGMPAEVLIVNGARSVLDFLISPIVSGMNRAMKEE